MLRLGASLAKWRCASRDRVPGMKGQILQVQHLGLWSSCKATHRAQAQVSLQPGVRCNLSLSQGRGTCRGRGGPYLGLSRPRIRLLQAATLDGRVQLTELWVDAGAGGVEEPLEEGCGRSKAQGRRLMQAFEA